MILPTYSLVSLGSAYLEKLPHPVLSMTPDLRNVGLPQLGDLFVDPENIDS